MKAGGTWSLIGVGNGCYRPAFLGSLDRFDDLERDDLPGPLSSLTGVAFAASVNRGVTMFWDAEYVLRQLLAAMPGPRQLSAHKRTARSGTPVASYGCCPVCHEFVGIRAADRAGTTPCPNCGHWISSLDPLGSDGPTGVNDDP